jgi:hypothetical protein
MAKEQFYKEITLDSADFRTGSLNRPTFYFDSFMDTFDYVIPTRITVPTTYYVFSSPSYVSCTINGTAVTWAAGNYTPAEWISVVQPQVSGLTITYSAITNKLTFTAGSTVTVAFSATQKAWELLGFNAGSNSNGTTTLTSPNVVQFSGPNYLVLHSRIASVFNNSSIYFSKSITSGVQEDKFIMVPVDVNRNSVIYYTALPQRFFEWFDSSTRSLEFYFTLGQREELVDFNGATFQIKLAGYSRDDMSTDFENRNVRVLTR